MIDFGWLRSEILGHGVRFRGPFGERLLLYADYTASGRSLRFLERYLMAIEERYANTHTEDDETGRTTSRMLEHAEREIKRMVNGNADTCIVAAGTGATGAIKRLQEILGIYLPPATRERLESLPGVGCLEARKAHLPLVLVGPYEHHSNEISWRECLAEVREVDCGEDGCIDLADLERLLSDPRDAGRIKIGSFSAASNVTGMRSPTHQIARILHRHGALACFDYAASAPYVEIDMNRDDEAYFDAVFFSPHKFLGGPGSSGILLFNRKIYREDLPPTYPAGGTVDYVTATGQFYNADIETREKPGTPGTLQVVQCMLAMQLKQAIGTEVIERRERRFTETVLRRFGRHPNIELLGNPDPTRRLGIVSFNLKDGERHLHPKLVTRLLNDLFGIQSRAGCSCAGPYGHRLLGLDPSLGGLHRELVLSGVQGFKPGWVRLCLHYSMDHETVEFIARAVEFLAEHGGRFLPLYRFDPRTGSWSHLDESVEEPACEVRIARAVQSRSSEPEAVGEDRIREEQDAYLEHAEAMLETLPSAEAGGAAPPPGYDPALADFNVVHLAAADGEPAGASRD